MSHWSDNYNVGGSLCNDNDLRMSILKKVNWDDYQEMYRRVENLANICFAGRSSIYEISEAYALIKPLLDTIKERTDLIYELDEQIDDEDDF